MMPATNACALTEKSIGYTTAMPRAIHLLTTPLIQAVIIALLCASAHASVSDHMAYCAGMQYCLQECPPGCTPEDCLPQQGITYSDTYCSIFNELQARGLKSATAPGRQIYLQAAGRHRVEYRIDGTLPMPAAVMLYLMNNLPFATQLVNAYQKTDFKATYLDRSKRSFTGSGERLSGTFTRVLQNTAQTRSLYSGSGTVEVLVWNLRGTSVIIFDFDEIAGRQCVYSLRCLIFPDSAVVKSILSFSLFRNSIIGVLERTCRSIQDAAMAFHRGERAPVESYPGFDDAEGRRQLEEFDRLLQRTMQDAETASGAAAEKQQQEPAGMPSDNPQP